MFICIKLYTDRLEYFLRHKKHPDDIFKYEFGEYKPTRFRTILIGKYYISLLCLLIDYYKHYRFVY